MIKISTAITFRINQLIVQGVLGGVSDTNIFDEGESDFSLSQLFLLQ